jgi:hypothetical protein
MGVGEALASALSRCPFLHSVSEAHGDEFARRLALNPFAPAATGRASPIFAEDALSSFAAVVNIFHGPRGAVPLTAVPAAAQHAAAGRCPFGASAAKPSAAAAPPPRPAAAPAGGHPLGRAAPAACISLAAFGGGMVSALASALTGIELRPIKLLPCNLDAASLTDPPPSPCFLRL